MEFGRHCEEARLGLKQRFNPTEQTTNRLFTLLLGKKPPNSVLPILLVHVLYLLLFFRRNFISFMIVIIAYHPVQPRQQKHQTGTRTSSSIKGDVKPTSGPRED